MATIRHLQSRQHTILGELERFLTDLQDRRGLSEHTIAAYRCDLRTLGTVLTTPLDLITTADIEAFLTSRREKPGTRVAYDSVHYRWTQVYQAAGLIDMVDGRERPQYTIHQLRHTAETAFIGQYPQQIVSHMLGHRDPRSTRRYADVTEDRVRAVLATRRRR